MQTLLPSLGRKPQPFRCGFLLCHLAIFIALPPIAGCTHVPPAAVDVASGIVLTRDDKAGVQLLDVDLLTAHVQPIVVTANVARRAGGNYVGDAHSVREWADAAHALGGVNGGFFGETYDQFGQRKQIVGLAETDGRVVAPCPFVTPRGSPDQHLVRSAVGFTADGRPDIAWATSDAAGTTLTRSNWPINPTRSGPWRVQSAVMGGPRLFSQGQRRITDGEERLVSPGKLSRTFIAYDWDGKRPRHLVLGRANAMEFSDVASYLTDYFARAHGSAPREALCLDGGPSSQLAYRDPATGDLTDAAPTGVTVPTAVLLVPEKVSLTETDRFHAIK